MKHPKPTKNKKSLSDGYLNTLWSQAVKAGKPWADHAHHIIRRSHFATRWDYKNGLALTVEEHEMAHKNPLAFGRLLFSRCDMDYLMAREKLLKHDFLAMLGLTENEYRVKVAEELKEIIRRNT